MDNNTTPTAHAEAHNTTAVVESNALGLINLIRWFLLNQCPVDKFTNKDYLFKLETCCYGVTWVRVRFINYTMNPELAIPFIVETRFAQEGEYLLSPFHDENGYLP